MQLAHRRRPSKLLILPQALHQQAVHLLEKQQQHCRRGRLLRHPPLRSLQMTPALLLQSCQQWNLLLLLLRRQRLRNPSLLQLMLKLMLKLRLRLLSMLLGHSTWRPRSRRRLQLRQL